MAIVGLGIEICVTISQRSQNKVIGKQSNQRRVSRVRIGSLIGLEKKNWQKWDKLWRKKDSTSSRRELG